jgi:outer membrane biosynthesis protein TonB
MRERQPVARPVSGGTLIKFVRPICPPGVTAKAIAEGVVVELTIDKQGFPKDLRTSRNGNRILASAVLAAMRQWRWSPYRLDANPIEIKSSIYVRFELRQ